MSGNRDELPEPTDSPQGSSRSRQQETQDEIAERLGIDPALVATRDTLDRGIQQRLTGEGQQAAERTAAQRVAEQAGFIQRDDVRANVDPETFAVDQRLTEEGITEAEQRLTEQTAADQEFVRPADLQANVDPETFSAEASLTESGRQNAQQRQAEQLRQQAASQSDRFGADDFAIDRSGDEIEAEPTQSAIEREQREQAAQQFESGSEFIDNVSRSQVNLTDDGAQLDDSVIERAEARAQQQARQEQRQEFASRIESGDVFNSGNLPEGVDPSSLIDTVDPQQDISVNDGQLQLDDSLQSQINNQITSTVRQRQRQEFAQSVESGSVFSESDLPNGIDPSSLVNNVDPNEDITVNDGQLAVAGDVQSQINSQISSTVRQRQRQEFEQAVESGSAFGDDLPDGIDPASLVDNVDPNEDITVSDGQLQLDDSLQSQINNQITSTVRQRQRRDFAQSVESGSVFNESDLPNGIDASSLVDNVDPNEDITVSDGQLTLADSLQSEINNQITSTARQQQRQEFAQALESGEAFESGEAPDALGNVDPQTDVEIEDDQLTLADETQAELVESQIREQAGATPGLNTEGVLQRAASQDQILQAVEQRIESQSGTDVRPGLIEDVNLRVTDDGTIEADRVLLNSRRFDDFRDVSTLRAQSDLLDGAELSFDATEQFDYSVEQSIAEQISDRNVVDVSSDQIDISGGNVGVPTPESLTIENDQITANGLTESGQADFARRQLQSIQTTEGVSVDTPVNSQPFANVSAQLAQAAEGGGSLSSATRIVAASDTVSNVGDLDDLPDARIIEGLEPEQAEERLGIDASTVREAQSDIESRRQQLESDPGAVLESIASNQDEFVEDSTRIGVAGERGQRIRQSARTQINQLEQSIAAGDDDVSPGDVNLSLTDDLSGIRSVNQAGQRAIAEQVDSQLANFGAEEINVGVSDGQITTSIEDSVRERFVQNAQRVQEIQVRNQIADSTEGIGRRDIEVDAGEGISPSDQLVTETLGADVDVDIESFEQLEQAANIQARQQARQQALEQVNSQTIGSVDPRNVTVERTSDGFEANVSGAAANPVDLSPDDATAIDTTVENQSPEITDPIRALEGGLRDVGAGLDDTLSSAGRTVGSTLADINIGVQAAQQATNSDIGDRFFEEAGAGGARALNPATFAAEGVQTADILARGPNREFGLEDLPGAGDAAALQAGAEGDLNADLPQTSEDFVVGAGEQDAAQLSRAFDRDPVGTAGQLTGGIITGTVAGTAASRAAFRVGRADLNTDARIDNRPDLGSGGRGSLLDPDTVDAFRAGNRGQLDLTGRQRGGDATEPEINDERLSPNLRQQTITRRQRELADATEGGTFEGVDDPIEGISERARRSADVGDFRERTRQSVDIDDVRATLTPEGAALSGLPEEQTPEVAFDDSIDSVDPGGELDDPVDSGEPEVAFDDDVGSVNAGGELAETVDSGGVFESGIDSQFRQQIGETGEQQFFDRRRSEIDPSEDIEDRLGVNVGADVGADVGARPREDVDSGVGVAPRTDVGTDQRQDTRLNNRQDTDVGTPRVTGREINANREVGTPRTTDIDIPRFGTPDTPRPDFPETPEADNPEEEQRFGLQSADDLFDSEILSGEEALQQTFGSDNDRDDRFSL